MKEELVKTKKKSNYSQESLLFLSCIFFFFVNSLNDLIKKYVKLCNDWLECVYMFGYIWVSEQADRCVPFLPQDEVKLDGIYLFYLYPVTHGIIE